MPPLPNNTTRCCDSGGLRSTRTTMASHGGRSRGRLFYELPNQDTHQQSRCAGHEECRPPTQTRRHLGCQHWGGSQADKRRRADHQSYVSSTAIVRRRLFDERRHLRPGWSPCRPHQRAHQQQLRKAMNQSGCKGQDGKGKYGGNEHGLAANPIRQGAEDKSRYCPGDGQR